MQPKFVAAQKNVIKNRNPANIRKWIACFITLGIYTSAEARVLLANNWDELPTDMGNFICTAH